MNPIRRILVVQPYGIGDLLFLTPVFRAARVLPGLERLDLLLGSRTAEIVRRNPHVDEVMVVDKDLFHRRGNLENLKEAAALSRKIKAARYDLLLDFSLRGEYAFAAQFLWGIRRRAGFNYKRRGFFHNIRVSIPEGFKGRHVAEHVIELAEKAGIPVRDRFLEFYPEESERREAAEILEKARLGRFVAVSAGGGESWGRDAHFKRWPAANFAALVERLRAKIDFDGAVLLGSPAEKPLTAEVAAQLRIPVLDLAGVPLRLAAAVLERAALYTGNDGGLLHLAHALRVPVIGMYGPVDPAVYGPFPGSNQAIAVVKENLECRPCYQKFRYKSDCAHRDCLQRLTPEEAMEYLENKNFFRSGINGEAEKIQK